MTQTVSTPTTPQTTSTTGVPVEEQRRLKLAYLTTEYPKASHTFVRREIVALEERGHDIMRVSIRDAAGAVVDPADVAEAKQTVYCLGQPLWKMAFSMFRAAITRPRAFLRACRISHQMWKVSDRGAIRHLAYLVEAVTLLWILQRRQVEHVHVHFGKNAADVARLVHCLGGPTYSMTIHGPGEYDGPRSFSLGPKIEESLFTVAISSFGTGQLRRWVGHEHWNKFHIVRCTISEDFLGEIQPIDNTSNQFVCIGRLTGQKGQLLLIDAIHQLASEGRDVQLVLAGDGEMRDAIEARIDELGVQDFVTITGWIGEEQVRQHLLESRAMVLPSFAEGLPVAIMEALALGRPAISTSIAGIPELLRNGENGWLITSGSVDALVEAMRDALDTPVERLNQMGQAGQDRVRKQHHAAIEAEKLESLFQQFV